MAMIRFLPDGSPDPAFGAHHSGRRIVTAPGIEPGSTWPADIALLPDGKIVVASTSWTWPLIVLRYDPNGTLDRSFGDRGWVTPSSPDFVEDAVIAVQPDGKVLVGGTAPVAGSLFDFVLVRLLQDGRLDASSGLDGVATVDVGGRTNELGDLVIGGRGRIIAGGTVVRTLPPPPGSPTTSTKRQWLSLVFSRTEPWMVDLGAVAAPSSDSSLDSMTNSNGST